MHLIKNLFEKNIIKLAALMISIYFLILTIGLLSGFLAQFTWLISSLVLGIIIALIIRPINEIFETVGLPRSLSIIGSYIVLFAIISVIVFLLLPPLIEELNTFLGPGIKQIKESFPSLDPINNFLKQLNSNATVSVDQITKPITENVGDLISNIGSIASNIAGILIQFILGLIFSIFIISDGKKLFSSLLRATPKTFKDDYKVIIQALVDGFRSFIKVQGISALVYALFVMLCMKVLGYDYILICGVLSFIAFLIPGIGGPIALIPPLIFGILFKSSDPINVIFLMVVILVIQNIILNIIVPRLYGKTLGIHPALVLIVILVSLQLFGILGVILAIPIASAIQQVLNHSMNNAKLQKSDI